MSSSIRGKSNAILYDLSCKYALQYNLKTKFLGFKCIKELHENDDDFSLIYHTCSYTTFEVYFKNHRVQLGELLLKRHIMVNQWIVLGCQRHMTS